MKSKYIYIVLVLVALGLTSSQQVAAEPQSITITNPTSDVTMDEASEYATLVWNDPWDMSQALDVQQLDSPKYAYPNRFNVFSCDPGLWCAVAAAGSTELFLLTPGYSGAMHVGRDGNLRRINASVYKRLTFRMWLDQVPSGAGGWQLAWTNGTVADFGNASVAGQSVYYPLQAGWNIYSVDLSNPPLWGMPWSGNLTGLRLDIGLANMTGRTVKLDWARLSVPNGDNRTITWSATNEGGNVDLGFISSDGTSTRFRNNIMVGNIGKEEAMPASSGSYLFRGSLPPDDWRVNLRVPATGHSATSSGRWRVQAAPTLSFVQPSYTSGADYAAVVKNDPWDMNNSADVGGGIVGAVHKIFANGIVSAQSLPTSGATSDPEILFLPNPLPDQHIIDTGRFRYATFRLKVDGTTDISNGYIARLVWQNWPFTFCGVSNDMPLHAGWNVVSLDLWDNGILDDQAGPSCSFGWRAVPARYELRLDPHEIPQATYFYLDYFLLTAMDSARTSGNFPIKYTLGTPGDSVVFYYNTTRTTNGRQRANAGGQAAPAVAAFRLFLPSVYNQVVSSGPPGTQTYFWNLAGVSPNTYYISADVSDGFKTVTWFSDTPVLVTP